MSTQLMESFLSYLKDKKKSENTIKSYRYDLTPFAEYFESQKINITTIKAKDIESYLSTITSKASSMNRYMSSLQSFYKYLMNIIQVIDYNPIPRLERPNIPDRKPVFLKEAEALKLLNSVIGEHKERDYAILTIFLNCCLRLSELISIDINKVDFENQTITVIGKGDKEREVDLTPSCITAINNYLKVRQKVKGEEALFLSERNRRMSTSTVQQLVKKYIGIANLDEEKYHTHSLRHTGASLIYKKTKDIRTLQEILGHSDIKTTQIYTHIDKEHRKSVANSNPLSNISI